MQMVTFPSDYQRVLHDTEYAIKRLFVAFTVSLCIYFNFLLIKLNISIDRLFGEMRVNLAFICS